MQMGRILNSGCLLWGSCNTTGGLGLGRIKKTIFLIFFSVSKLKKIKKQEKIKKNDLWMDSFWRLLLVLCFK